MSKDFALIVAATASMGIGNEGKLPWKSIKGDMAFFKKTTTETKDRSKKNALIMGRKTYLGIPQKFRPLPDRINIVVSGNPNLRTEEEIPDSVYVVNSFEAALSTASGLTGVEKIFVAGGASIYEESMKHEQCKHIYYTNILVPDFVCDTFFPVIDKSVFKVVDRSDVQEGESACYEFVTYSRV